VANYHQVSAVQTLVAQGQFRVTSIAARDILRGFLGDRGFEKRIRVFGQAVISRLQIKMFCRTTRDTVYNGKPTAYDVYGVQFSKADLVALGFPEDEELPLAWMVKVAIVNDGTLVDILSPHPITDPLHLENNATLNPRNST
jgi:hypothetical protein